MSKAENKHTPGPWRVVWYPRRRTAEIETVIQEPGKYRHMTNEMPMCAGPQCNEIEYITDDDGRAYQYSSEACANARLFAAAPELPHDCGQDSCSGYQLWKRQQEERKELLEALEALPLNAFDKDMSECDAAEFIDHSAEFFEAMKLARAAIRKAKGGE